MIFRYNGVIKLNYGDYKVNNIVFDLCLFKIETMLSRYFVGKDLKMLTCRYVSWHPYSRSNRLADKCMYTKKIKIAQGIDDKYYVLNEK